LVEEIEMKSLYWLALPILAVTASNQLAPTAASIEDTMKFIQDKLINQGPFGYVTTKSSIPGTAARTNTSRNDALADPVSCSLHTTATTSTVVEIEAGVNYAPGGTPLTGADLHTISVNTSTIAFKDVESVTTEPLQDQENKQIAKTGHPETTVTIAPTVFAIVLTASKPAFTVHRVLTQGNRAPKEDDHTVKEVRFIFYDETIASRVSNAMTHAMELCGGGNKDPF
jgi:hypothetical protein